MFLFTCSVCSFGSNFLNKWYKCKTGVGSKCLIKPGNKSKTCLLQCFNCAACQIVSICSLVILPSDAKKLSVILHCLIT